MSNTTLPGKLNSLVDQAKSQGKGGPKRLQDIILQKP